MYTNTNLKRMPGATATEVRARFELCDGQIRSHYTYKNLWWTLNMMLFGYGDINQDDIQRIQDLLSDNEVFRGWNEHHGTESQQTNYPMIIITKKSIFVNNGRRGLIPQTKEQ